MQVLRLGNQYSIKRGRGDGLAPCPRCLSEADRQLGEAFFLDVTFQIHDQVGCVDFPHTELDGKFPS